MGALAIAARPRVAGVYSLKIDDVQASAEIYGPSGPTKDSARSRRRPLICIPPAAE